MYFDTKSYLKSNHYHTAKHPLNTVFPNSRYSASNALLKVQTLYQLRPYFLSEKKGSKPKLTSDQNKSHYDSFQTCFDEKK